MGPWLALTYHSQNCMWAFVYICHDWQSFHHGVMSYTHKTIQIFVNSLCLYFRLLQLLLNQTWVCLPMHSKTNLLTPACGEGKYSVYCRAPSEESKQLVFIRPKLPEAFQGKVFKDRVREGGYGVCDQLMDIILICWW